MTCFLGYINIAYIVIHSLPKTIAATKNVIYPLISKQLNVYILKTHQIFNNRDTDI
jgi:hypothetical protein